jgi:hypothetical protein
MNRLPVRLFLFADGVFVTVAKDAGLAALGRRVDAIDGLPAGDVVRKLRIYRGGRDNLRDYDDLSLLESPELLHAAGIARSSREVTLTVSDEDHSGDIRLFAQPPSAAAPDVQRHRYLTSQRVADDDAGLGECLSGHANAPVAPGARCGISPGSDTIFARGLSADENEHRRERW